MLFLLLSWMWKKARKFDGQILAGMMALYPIMRINIEEFRGDTVRGVDYFGFLSTSQLVSLGMLLVAGVIVVTRWRHGVAPETPFVPEEDPLEE